MNRRDFFAKLLIAQAAFLILPAARTYRRTWRQLLCPKPIVIPGDEEYVDVWYAFAHATEDLDQYIFKEAHRSSIWLNLIPKQNQPRDIFSVGRTELVAGEGKWHKVDLCS